MNKTPEKLLGSPFDLTAQTDPTDRLCQRVMHKIERREVARLRSLIFGFGILAAGAIAAFIPALQYLKETAASSGLGQYLSLITSDGSYVLSHWQDFFLSITEALPVTAIMSIVALALVGLLSLRWFMRYQVSLSEHRHRLALS